MTNSQKISVELSEKRSTLNGLIEKRNKLPEGTNPSEEDIKAMDAATKEIRELEVRYRAEMTKEGHENTTEEVSNTTFDKEERERRRILADSSIVPFMAEALEGKKLDGREAEVRAAVLGENAGNEVPIDLLLNTNWLEQRALFAEGKIRA